MPQEIYIECGTGADTYRVELTAKDKEVFENASKHEHVLGKTGENLVAALLEVAGGDIPKVTRRNAKGELNDGMHGEPSLQLFNFDGSILQIEHFRDGVRHDSPNGEPAFVQALHENGIPVVRTERFTDGVRCNGANAAPAIEKFEDGILAEIIYCENGRPQDRKNGEPALQRFNADGALIAAERYNNGILVRQCSPAEVMKYRRLKTAAKAKPGPSGP